MDEKTVAIAEAYGMPDDKVQEMKAKVAARSRMQRAIREEKKFFNGIANLEKPANRKERRKIVADLKRRNKERLIRPVL